MIGWHRASSENGLHNPVRWAEGDYVLVLKDTFPAALVATGFNPQWAPNASWAILVENTSQDEWIGFSNWEWA
jgi:hypothetical protein